MTLVFHPPPATTSPLGRLDARWKLAAVAVAASCAAAVRTPLSAVAFWPRAVLLAILGRLPWRWCAARLGPVLLFVAVFAVPLIFLPGKDAAVWKVGPASLSLSGATTALVLFCKAAALVLLALVVLATAPLDATLKAAHDLYVPGLLVQLAILSYRYVFVLAEELGKLRVALRVRGYRNRADLHCYRTIGSVTGGLLVRGWEQGERVGHAMRCRGFDGRFRSLSGFHTTVADVLTFVVVAGAAVGIVAADFLT